MRILQVSKHFPYPARDGYTVAVTCLSKALHRLGAEVHLLSMNTTKHWVETPEKPDFYAQMDTVRVDNRITPWGALANLFSRHSYLISRFVTPEFAARLKTLLTTRHFDIIQLESVQLAPYIPLIRQFSKARVCMRAHNVEHEIWERQRRETRSFFKKIYLKSQIAAFRKTEIESLSEYDILAAITEKDLDFFRRAGFAGRGVVVPVGMDPEAYAPDWSAYDRGLSLGFIGSLDWMPNQEGIAWFLREVWPVFSQKYPDIRLEIAGRHAPPHLGKNLPRNVRLRGEVADARAFMNAHSAMIVPLFSGSGIRVKILEAMALGRTVISTPVGMEGIAAKHRKEILTAATRDEFLKELSFCATRPERILEIGRAARAFILDRFDNLELARRLLTAYEMP
ncbi:MAG: glycosyltransferase [Bacteroidetes bacterium]|nr:MAG: glycosyltransferase [Bacteroidota bacterium]